MKQKIIYTLALLFATMQTFAQTYTYDNLNRLKRVVYENGTTVTYTYDALGNRTKKTVTGAAGIHDFTVTVTASPLEGGTVFGGGTYTSGTVIELIAAPNDGYKFTKWNDGVTDNPRTITVTRNMSFTALFEAISSGYTITVTAIPVQGGTVSGGGTYTSGTTIELVATPNAGYEFVEWSDGVIDNPRSVTVTRDMTYTAHFLAAGFATDWTQKVILYMRNNRVYEYGVPELNDISVDDQKMQMTVNKTNSQQDEYSVLLLDSITFVDRGNDVHEYVDLGLPSGTLWATCNVGANSPEEYGDYFAWGETDSKNDYWWSTYKYCNGSDGSVENKTITKYCTKNNYGYDGFTDNRTELEPEDDAATINWSNEWQMPSLEQFEELLDDVYTTTEWITRNGMNGILITSKSNGKSIFLPAAGMNEEMRNYDAGDAGWYWSRSLSTRNPSYASFLHFRYTSLSTTISLRSRGHSVRPVRVIASDMPTDGLVAYYPFNGNANDESGNGNHGSVIGNVELTADRFGNPNSAYRFPGQPFNYISVPDNESLHLSTFTLNAWVYTDGEDYGSGYLIDKGRDIENGTYRLCVTNVGGTNLYGGSNNAYIEENPQVKAWHMVSGSIEGNVAKYYLDGVLMDERTLSNAFVYGNSDPLALGMHYYSGVPSYWAYPLLGVLDDVRIYNRVLSASEIKALYEEPMK